MKKDALYQFVDSEGSFRVDAATEQGILYFPLVNEQGLMSSIAPDLGGDIKMDQHTFLTLPVSYEDLNLSRATRNFWLSIDGKKQPWAVNGRSVWQRADGVEETSTLDAGLLWQRLTRTNKALGVNAQTLNFVPAGPYGFEVMQVTVKNVSKKPLTFTATSAVPLYGRSADNLRDHRHVTSLLHRIKIEKFGVSVCPTMTFNERGHLVNRTSYYVIGADEKGQAPVGVFPTIESFTGIGGDLERPKSLMEKRKPVSKIASTDQGKEAMGALQFKPVKLKPGQSTSFVLLLGIDKEAASHDSLIGSFASPEQIGEQLKRTQQYWDKKLSTIRFETGDNAFNGWVRWVQTQPTLRKLFGCSFLPDFDYGRGGRGWRDLWQDCLALLLQSPEEVRDDIVHNYGGVRIDGSNATIIGRKKVGEKWMPEFIADRNNISRTWMDHGVWPFLTTLLYLNQTGDWKLLTEKVPYFRDALIHRAKKVDEAWRAAQNVSTQPKLLTKDSRVYEGSVIEHMLVEMLVQFFNVGEHNIIKLEDADWNDGLDMAHHRGESVAFTNMYGGNLGALAHLLERLSAKQGWRDVSVAEELLLLLDRVKDTVDYDSVDEKRKRLERYFEAVSKSVSGKQVAVPIEKLIHDLRDKSGWIKQRINSGEWVEKEGQAFYNGYYDDHGRRVEGVDEKGRLRMTLSGQVYPIMAGIADDARIHSVIKAVDAFLFDKKLGGVRLNTDFGAIQPELGRAFSFAFGEKENGAVFSHMAVMYANALYQRGFAKDGYRVLNSLFEMAKNSARSRIFPGLPEYFNNEGRGRYMYLTGSASWYVLTLLTQAFGVRGLEGDLLLAPKLEPEQFDKKGRASVSVRFAGATLHVTYVNPRRVPYEKMRIKNVTAGQTKLAFEKLSDREVLVKRSAIFERQEWNIEVELA